MLSSASTSQSAKRVHHLLLGASTAARRDWIAAPARTTKVQQFSRRVAARPHGGVRGALESVDTSVRTH